MDYLLLMMMINVLLLWMLPEIATATEYDANANLSALLDSITADYDKRIPPNYGKSKCNVSATSEHTGKDSQCVVVFINIYICSMFSVSENEMEYSMTLLVRERWRDDRLSYNTTLNITRFEMEASFLEKIWRPDVYIVNEKKARFHDVTVPNEMVHVYHDGTVQISVRVTGVFSCSMDFSKYPFDTQDCYMELESYAHSTDAQVYVWSDTPVSVAEGITFPQFILANTSQYICTRDYYGIQYPCVGIKFILERTYSYYIIQIYVPSMVIVVLSWVSFWLDAEVAPARITLGLLTVLTMETQSSSARANLPTVSSVKAIDVWMAVCLTFVFMALIEFAYVNVSIRVRNRRQTQTPHCNGNAHGSSNGSLQISKVADPGSCDCFQRLGHLDRARFVDKVSRAAFPVAFLLFNAGYWLYYFK